MRLRHISCGVKVDFKDMDGIAFSQDCIGDPRAISEFSSSQDYPFMARRKAHLQSIPFSHKWDFSVI
jgi:hypothetical protein